MTTGRINQVSYVVLQSGSVDGCEIGVD